MRTRVESVPPKHINKFHIVTSLIFIASLAFMWPTWASLGELWGKMDLAYSYGFLSLAICLYFLWEVFKDEHRVELAPSSTLQNMLRVLCLLATFVASCLWFVTESLQVSIGSQLLLFSIITAGIGSTFGFNILLKTFPALVFLGMSIPIWNYLNTTLQTMTTSAVTFALSLTDIPAYIEGNFISLPYGTLEVAGGCSGLRYFLVSIVLAHFYNLQYLSTYRSKIIVYVVTILFGIATNWVRVHGLVLVAYYSEMQHYLITVDHDLYGWVIFALCMAPLLYFYKYLDADINQRSVKRLSASFSRGMFAATLIAMAFGPLLLWCKNIMLSNIEVTSPSWTTTAPNGWLQRQEAENREDIWQLGFQGYTYQQHLVYRAQYAKQTIGLLSVFYTMEHQGNELVGYDNNLSRNNKWRVLSSPPTYLAPQTVQVNSEIAILGLEKRLIMSFYQVGQKRSLGGLRTKLDQLKTTFDVTQPKSFNAFVMSCLSNCEEEAAKLSDFVDEFIALNKLQPSKKL